MTESGTLTEQQLRRELARPLLSLGFQGPLEREFRDSLRGERRLPRALFYLFPVLLFGLAPFYGQALLKTPDAVLPYFRWAELAVLAPLCLLAALVDYTRLPLGFSRAIHAIALLVLWGLVIVLRHISVELDFYFPFAILGLCMIGAAVLCGYGLRVIAPGIVVFSAAGLLSEILLARSASMFWMDALLHLLLALLAVTGSWFNEGLYRRLWLQSRLVEIAAYKDALTGLINRAEFNRRFAQAFALARRESKQLVVMLLDVDRFKQVNDRYGHLYGDKVLRAVGEAVSDTAARRPIDIAARYGGEEMVVVWYDMPAEAIPMAASRVLDRIRSIRLPTDGGVAPPISASAGVAYLAPKGNRTPEEVLHVADMLMYTAKREGRDRFNLQQVE